MFVISIRICPENFRNFKLASGVYFIYGKRPYFTLTLLIPDHLYWVAGHFLVRFRFKTTPIFIIPNFKYISTVATLIRSNELQCIIKWLECTKNKGFKLNRHSRLCGFQKDDELEQPCQFVCSEIIIYLYLYTLLQQYIAKVKHLRLPVQHWWLFTMESRPPQWTSTEMANFQKLYSWVS